MKTFIVLAVTILAVNALTVQEQWSDFKVSHSKSYTNIIEERLKYLTFQDNLKKIEEHNARYEAGLETYFLGVNQFADLTTEEFSALLKQQKKNRPQIQGSLHVENLTAPDTIDWRQKGAVLAVKDQGQCGSCWAFSATGAIEGQNALLNNQKTTLSEQQLLDCSGSYGNGNCQEGGDMVLAFRYVQDHGIESEAAYPYKAKQGSCQANSAKTVLKVKGHVSVAANENSLKNAVGTVGPISVAIYADPIQLYAGGIFKSNSCYNSASYLDHGVLAVGYGNSPSDYWIVKNSWGASWGESGYFRLARNANQCGIALDTSYPTLK